ncbi:MAG: hypothetical protein U1D41_02860 [Nitrosomonas sp.]|uniref:hypothetical protein n=1 Tax=Nitrosomonas sp. TaxID=42353 RepID=UPI00272111D4|nr:hypothetical protein [Nitrosomonas sp.]MDO8994345.1 hypothetical protein [Daejeonella sp.]MDP3279464.1 hypothetical protein [Nitrosomonas sp.]MDP3664229.1 hypothetical protein [Nitrosomonas sp.]MDZ4105100.1 hypothetical protein [Nitrosomonas sp.]
MHWLFFIVSMITTLNFAQANQPQFFDEDIWHKPSDPYVLSNDLITFSKTDEGTNPSHNENLLFNWPPDVLTAYSSLALAFVTLLLLFVGGATAIILYIQTLHLKRSVDASIAQFVTINRAWIDFKVAFSEDYDDSSHPSPIRFDDSGMRLTLKFTLKNVGNQAAFNVSPHWKICLMGSHSEMDLGILQKKLCDEVKNPIFFQGFTIFPGDSEKIFFYTCDLPQSEIDSDFKRQLQERGGYATAVHLINVIVIGCIDYQTTIDSNQHHQTGFAYYISATQANNGKMHISGHGLPVQREPILIEHLVLSSVLIGHNNFFFAD